MTTRNKKEPLVLLFGDFVVFYMALWLTLLLRYWRLPNNELLGLHLASFSIIFIVWICVFFIAGLYEKQTLILKSRMSGAIMNAQIANSVIAVIFFYLIAYFGITPKTNLFIDLLLSFGMILLWRLYFFPSFEVRNKEQAILVGTGVEMSELEQEVNNNPRYGFTFVSTIDLATKDGEGFENEVATAIESADATIVVADVRSERIGSLLPKLYDLIFSQVKFVDMHKLYEDTFDRIPLSLVEYSWFLENIAGTAQKSYDFLKRSMDLILSFVLTLASLVFYPFVYVAIKMEDAGPIFFAQERVGKNNTLIRVVKFRSLEPHTSVDGIAPDPKPTTVGKFLRKTRIDELPQLWSVLNGDLSLIGPRPEIPRLVEHYEKEIPYYNIRHLIKPGLSGWAQLYQAAPPKWGMGVNETRTKLSYDLYYIKNRSLLLDLKVALRTIKTLLSREGV